MGMFFNTKRLAGDIPTVGGVPADVGIVAQTPVMPERREIPRWAGIAADALAGLAGRPGMYALGQERRRQEEFELAAQQRQQAGQYANWVAQQQWKQANPDPTQATDLQRKVEYLDGLQAGLGQQYAQNQANPIQGVPITNPDGSSGIQFIRPNQMGGGGPASMGGANPPAAPVGKLTPLGGAAPQGVGRFR